MKTRIKIELPDIVNDVCVKAQVRKNFFSCWTDISTTWAFYDSVSMEEKIAQKVEQMKRKIDAYRSNPRIIKYPEDQ